MDDVDQALAALANPDVAISEDGFNALSDRVFVPGSTFAWTVAVRIVPRLVELAIAGNRNAAMLVLDVVATARRGGHRKVLDAAASLAIAELTTLDPAQRKALELTRQLAVGGPMPSDEAIDDAVDELALLD